MTGNELSGWKLLSGIISRKRIKDHGRGSVMGKELTKLWKCILFGILVCSIAVYFLRVMQYFGEPEGRVKLQIMSKNLQRYYTLKCLIRDLLSNVFVSPKF